MSVQISFLKSISIRNKEAGLTEPSGLTIDDDENLWTVSDDTKKLFQITREGEILKDISVNNRDLEGITFDSLNCVIWAVDENSSKVIQYDSRTGRQLEKHALEDLDGYCAIENAFNGGNDDLEGIVFDPIRSELLLLKEASPKLLIARTPDMKQIVALDRLEKSRGFTSKESNELDLSGICYDRCRDKFWIISDKGKCVFVYDRRSGRVVDSNLLSSGERLIKNAEGIALSHDSKYLYIVSDSHNAELSIFHVLCE